MIEIIAGFLLFVVAIVIFIFLMYLAGYMFFAGMLLKVEQMFGNQKEGNNNEKETLN